ncbi:MAG: hypothetical protein ACN6O6_17810 [Pseudomonas sp.]
MRTGIRQPSSKGINEPDTGIQSNKSIALIESKNTHQLPASGAKIQTTI